MKRIIAILLCLMIVVGLTACRADEPETGDDAGQIQQEIYPVPEHIEEVTVDNPVTYAMVSTVKKAGQPISLTARLDENGQGHVEYVGDEKKVGTFEPEVLHGITAQIEGSGLLKLDGQSKEGEGADYASIYIEYADGKVVTADFTGAVPQEFREGYDALDEYFRDLTKEVPVYVPQPQVVGTVNSEALREIKNVLNKSEIKELDTLTITDVPLDETFKETVGLDSMEGITSGTNCAPMMLSSAYSFVIVTLDDADIADKVCDDFADNIAWNKWVCVSASHTMTAQKGKMALCLMGTGDFYDKTAKAIRAAGWDEIEEFTNPDM